MVLLLLLLLSLSLAQVRRSDPYGVHVQRLVVRLGMDRLVGSCRRRGGGETVGGGTRRTYCIDLVILRFRRRQAVPAGAFHEAVVHRRVSAIFTLTVPILE